MPNQLLQRYVNGEHREVWHDLMSLGAAVRDEAYYRDAVEVAEETMNRARHNVESIVVRLEKLGYEFTTEEPSRNLTAAIGGVPMDLSTLLETAAQRLKPFAQPGFAPDSARERAMAQMAEGMRQMQAQMAQREPQRQDLRAQRAEQRKQNAAQGALKNPDVFASAGAEAAAELDRFEKDIGGPFPISLRHWYQHVGAVNFMGFHDALNPADGPHSPDPLVIYPFRETAESDYGEDLSERDDDVLELMVAPDALHKAHTSGGDPYSIRIPDASADAAFNWDRPGTTFVEYLRLTFAWGGFPGWENIEERPRKELAYLQEHLRAL